MVFLYILLGVLALLLFILVIPIEVLAYYNETLTLRLKVLFVKITLLSPDKKKKEKPKKKEEKPKEKKPQEKKPEKKKKK